MGVFYETIPKSLMTWIMEQKMLWVGSAPLSGEGHINISPKGGPYFGIIDERNFWFMDLTGSGVETTSHLHEPGNGRLCVMFMAFDGPPKIVRLWGKGHVLENGTPAFSNFVEQHSVTTIPGTRSIITLSIHQVATSCGFSVPYYDFKSYRPILNDFFANKERKFNEGKQSESMDQYWAYKSQLSIDGLPGMKRGYEYAQKNGVQPLKKMVGHEWESKKIKTPVLFNPVHALLSMAVSFLIGVLVALTFVSPETLRAIQERQKAFL